MKMTWGMKMTLWRGLEDEGRSTTAALSNLQHGLFDAFRLFTAAAGEPDRDEGKLV